MEPLLPHLHLEVNWYLLVLLPSGPGTSYPGMSMYTFSLTSTHIHHCDTDSPSKVTSQLAKA